jgi:DNA invertase Pin-like site-specific DNA recombinase
MRAIGYTRVSSTEQINGTSLDSQRAQIEAYASMRGIELVAVLVDAGVSGGRPLNERPAGRELVKSLESAEADSVVICKLDRGFRSASDCLINVESWEKRNISVHILNLGGTTIDTSTPTGKFFITVMAGAAELERNLIKERCNEGRKARKAEGKRLGTIPFGYGLDADGKTLVENSQEQEAIRLTLSLHEDGHSYRAIAAELTRRGVQGKQGGTWSHRQVASILKRAA